MLAACGRGERTALHSSLPAWPNRSHGGKAIHIGATSHPQKEYFCLVIKIFSFSFLFSRFSFFFLPTPPSSLDISQGSALSASIYSLLVSLRLRVSLGYSPSPSPPRSARRILLAQHARRGLHLPTGRRGQQQVLELHGWRGE